MVGLLCAISSISPAHGGVPSSVTYSGRLTDGTGAGQSQVMALTFRLFGQEEGGLALWEEEFSEVGVEDGYFSVSLEDGENPADGTTRNVTEVFAVYGATWVSVCVGSGCLAASELLPRQRIGAVPYAVQSRHARMNGRVENLGLRQEDGVLVICGADGSDLGAANTGWVRIPGVVGGRTVELPLTANMEFDPSVHATGVGFGIDETRNWNKHVPFFIWAVNRNDTAEGLRLAVSRRFAALDSGPAKYLATYTSPPAEDTQRVLLVLGDVDTSFYADRPVVLVGVFRMQYGATDSAWFVSLPFRYADGLGDAALEQTFAGEFDMAPGQNGASQGKFFKANGGTAPAWPNGTWYAYRLEPTGHVEVQASFKHDPPAGQAPGALEMVLPFRTIHWGKDRPQFMGGGWIAQDGGKKSSTFQVGGFIDGSVTFSRTDIAFNQRGNGDMDDAGDYLQVHFRYKAF